MSRRWLLSLFCLAVPLWLFVQFAGARGSLRVNEAATRVSFHQDHLEVRLAVENSSGEVLHSRVELELLDSRNTVVSRVEQVSAIGRDTGTLALAVPFAMSSPKAPSQGQLLWYRIHYRITPESTSQTTTAEGIASLSMISPELFELRVAMSDLAREGARHSVRVQALHPTTRKPAAGIAVTGEVTLAEGDGDKGVKLSAAASTDASGYALLEFQMPSHYPQFPHQLQPAGGEIHVVGRRGVLAAEAERDVLVDQFPRILLSTDKPLYQPGQQLHMRALVLSPTRHALREQNVRFRVSDPEQSDVFRAAVLSSRFGVAAIDWPIPENTRLGDYLIKVALGDDEDSGQAYLKVRISRYDLPNFSVKVEPDRKYYLPGQNAVVKVRADYLFGQPVVRGHVRVVRETEREWNYKEQKWDIEEGDKYEGDTDASGSFQATIKFKSEYDEIGDYRRFQDLSYVAYFTDPTSRRTEQRRFDLRLSRQAIHVYLINADEDQSRILPSRFYVSTFYPDGTPAPCTVSIGFTTTQPESAPLPGKPVKTLLTAIRTNHYGLAKVRSLRLPALDDKATNELTLLARDVRGQTGSRTEELSTAEDPVVRIDTAKTLYRPGEPITALITSSNPEQSVVVDLIQDSILIHSERLQLRAGRASITFPYRPEFKDQVTVAAYEDFADYRRLMSSRTVLFPSNHDLKLAVQPVQASYRPGADASVSLRVQGAAGNPIEAVLGAVVIDQAVAERARTDMDFGSGAYGSGTFGTIEDFRGTNEQFAGVTLRQLEHLDLKQAISPELDLLAEVFFKRYGEHYAVFFASENDEIDANKAFRDLMQRQLAPLIQALTVHYDRTREYPKDEATLRRLLAQSGIELDGLLDPWGNHFRTVFTVQQQQDRLGWLSAGPDEQFDTSDDLLADSIGWAYFRQPGEALDRVVRKYHQRTGNFVRDFLTLRVEMAKEGVDLAALRDPWNQRYRFDFEVKQNQYEITVRSAGPDKRFAPELSYRFDDFVLWHSSIDYFAELRARIDRALSTRLKVTKHFPRNDAELAEALRGSEEASLQQLRDPWDRSYYASFGTQVTYTDRVRVEKQVATLADGGKRTLITPVTRTLITISVRSMGADGKAGTADDFAVASFSNILSEQTSDDTKARMSTSAIVLSGTNGAITGMVTDSQGAVVAGSAVTATQSQRTYTTTTDSEGHYALVNLPAGIYEVRFEGVGGFKTSVITNVVVEASSVTTVNVALEPGAATESVMVTSTAPSGDTRTISPTEINELPLNGKLGNNFILLSVKDPRQRLEASASSRNLISTPRLREYFPETLVWQPSIETDKQGWAQLNFKVADNITTWKLAVIGSTEDGEVGTAETEIKAFQPFFVEHDPPRILTEGDEISLPVVVRNYLSRAQSVDLEIKPENWFALLGPAHKRAEVAAGDAVRETFDLRASASVTDGKQRITANAADDNDAIEKPVTVHPDGEEQTATASDVVGEHAALELNLPASVIPNSARAEVKIYPNLLGHVTESVEAIMKRPYGCGEQTISSTYPSLLLLRHYKETKGIAQAEAGTGMAALPALQPRAERYLREGYSRLLNYRDDSGAFTYWGRGDPDLALTAYALRFLSEAGDLIEVDSDVPAKASAWLAKQQAADGSWQAYDYGSNVANAQRTALLTAYVARVLALIQRPDKVKVTADQKSASSNAAEQSAALKRALDYLSRRVNEIDEPYLLASYALASFDAGDVERAAPAVARLRALGHAEGNTTYWSLETNTPFYGWGLAGRVETTALVVQALARNSATGSAASSEQTEENNKSLTPSPNVAPAQTPFANSPAPTRPTRQTNDALIRSGLLFLLKAKDRYGVWYSTQATINVLDTMLALLQSDTKIPSPANSQSFLQIIVNGQAVPAVPWPAPNEFGNPIIVDVSRFLRPANNRIEMHRAHDSSLASVQAVASYYVPWSVSSAVKSAGARGGDSTGLRLVAQYDRTEAKLSDEITCHVAAERVGFHGYGMMLAEIGLPPGADVDRASLETAMKGSGWAISQYDILPDRVVVYLWPPAGGVKFDFKFRPRFGLKAKTAPSLIYDYYNPEARAVVAPVVFAVK